MQKISYDDRFITDVSSDFKDIIIPPSEFDIYKEPVKGALKSLRDKSGPGADFLGWHDLPLNIEQTTIKAIKEKAGEMRSKADVLVCIGIGGSYLGAKAAIEFLSPSFDEMRKNNVFFCGHTINSDYLSDLMSLLNGKEVAVNVISKSGTTTEPGVAFRVVRNWLENRYGRKGAAKRIIAVTDPHKGALRKLADEQGYASFDISADVGGRFSVFTPAGLFPAAFAGIDISKLVEGAAQGHSLCSSEELDKNIAARYAAVRNILFRRGYTTEVMAAFQPQLHYVNEWWKQLAGESEGKDGTGIFPAGLDYTTDLHSLGQWMQDGLRTVFETFMILKNTRHSVEVPPYSDDGDGLNYLAGRTFEQINNKAYQGTILAHLNGRVPSATIILHDRSEHTLGQLFYFFQKAIAVSGYLLRVNPFDQPGVEAYKKNMFALLGKGGFEELRETLESKTKDMKL